MKNFDYDNSLEKIKSALFDLYEDQEEYVGSIEDENRRNIHVEKYIAVKNKALDLINSIKDLYVGNDNLEVEKENVLDNIEPEQTVEVDESEPVLIEENNDNSTELEEYYLDDRNGTNPNFAYVSLELFNKIKNNGKEAIDNNIYKIDKEKKKGIIVRNDQFMKLSLSKHRQEGVLKEAKNYRIVQAKRSREKLINQNV